MGSLLLRCSIRTIPFWVSAVHDVLDGLLCPVRASVLQTQNNAGEWHMSRTIFSLVAAGALASGLGLVAPPAHAQDVVKIAAGAPLTGQIAKQGQEVANA